MIEEASDIDIRRVDRKSAPLLVFNKGYISMGFPDSSVGKESACNEGDPSSSPGLGRSAGEGKGYPLQYSWVSLVAQLVKNSACNVGDLGSIPGLGRSPGEGKATHSSILVWRIPWGTVLGVPKSWIQLSNFHFHIYMQETSV